MKTFVINLIILLLVPLSFIGQPLNIGILNDASLASSCIMNSLVKEEIANLMQAKGEVTFIDVYSNWDADRVTTNFNSLLNNPNVDMIIPIGLISSQLVGGQQNYSKPVLVTSNLATKLKSEIEYFYGLFNFKHLGVIIPLELKSYEPWIIGFLTKGESDYSIEIIEAIENNFRVNDSTDAVVVFPLFNFSSNSVIELMDYLSSKKIPVLAVDGSDYLELGATITFNTQAQLKQLARQTAVNILKFSEGAKGLDSVTYLNGADLIPYINMESLRKTERYPNWLLLENAVLINVVNVSQNELSLKSAISIALENNLRGKISNENLLLANKEVRIAKSVILPKLELSGTAMQLSKNLTEASMGQKGEFTFTGSLSLKQIIYSEAAYANIAIQKLIAQMEQHKHSKTSLDIILDVSSAYMALMFSGNNLKVVNENVNATINNLELSRFREKSGDVNFSDVNRWESELSMNKMALNDAQVQYKSAMYRLNEVLGMPLSNQISTPDTFTVSEIVTHSQEVMELFMGNVNGTSKYMQLIIDQMYSNSPELMVMQSAGDIADRKLSMYQTQQYVPEVALIAGADQAFIREGVIRNPQLPIPPPPDDITWNLGIRLSIPIFDGGRKREEIKKTRIEQDKLVMEESDLKNKLTMAVMSNVQFLSASYKEVKLAQRAYNAASANYKMVQDAYLTGVANISQLIDAQTVVTKTKIMALSAQYQYALDFIKTERLQGKYTFLDSENQKQMYRDLMITYLNK